MLDIIFINNADDYISAKARATRNALFLFECKCCHRITKARFIINETLPTVCRYCKMKTTQAERYGGIGFASSSLSSKVRNTCEERYGTAYPQKTDDVKNKMKETCEQKYGGSCPLSNDAVKEKMTKTCTQKYGSTSPLAADSIKDKISKTFNERYGGHPMYDHAIAAKSRKRKYTYKGIRFDSNAEIEFYKSLLEQNIPFTYQPDVCFTYDFEGKTHKYYPDFKVGDDYIEIKGSHFFKDGKMINPYDRSQDAIYEAKHQCMIRNNVKIILA